MSYIGATGLKTTDLIEEAEEKSLLASLINSATDVITDDIKGRVEDAILSYFDSAAAAAEWKPSITDVLSATGEIIQLGVLGELKMNKLDRSSVQDENSMVYTDKSQSTTNNLFWTDKVKIRYDNEWFSNAIYYEGSVKKGEILTYRAEQGSNILNLDATNIKLGTIEKDRLPSNLNNIGIGTTPATPLHIYHATDNILRLQTATSGKVSIEFARGTDIDGYTDYRFINDSGTFKLQYEDDAVGYIEATANLFTILPGKINLFKDTEIFANVGIGTTPATSLHIYKATNNILRLQTAAVDGTNSIEFVRGNTTDPLNDYRLITDTTGKFKLQYSTNVLEYGGTGSDLINISATNINLYKNTEISGNVGIGTTPDAIYKLDVNGTSRFTGNVGIATTPHATYKLDVLGDINATAFRGDGANITGLNQDNLVLTTQKIYERFSTTNFAIINDKIDLPPQYSINITAYDSTTLYSPSSDIRLKGKMSVSYDDRRNVYKLVSTETSITNNVAVLKYKAGDKISIKNIADGKNDFIYRASTNTNIYLKTCLYKRPIGISFNKDTDGLTNFTQVFEWVSGATPIVVDYRVQDGSIFPFYNFTNVMTFIVEAGYAYYLMRQWRDENNNYIETFLGDDFNDYLRAFGAGQTFRLESGYSQAGIDYTPRSYTPAELSVGTSQQLGGVKPRARMTIDSSGNLDANIPISADLINSMNTSHFTNNTGTSKIDISSTYVAPNATKLATSRNIAGVLFDGSENINIPYANLSSIPTTWGVSQIPDLAISKITNLQTTLDGKAPTSHTHTIANITNLQTTLDGKAPTSHNHAIADITNLQTTLDGKAPTSHNHAIADITNLQTTLDGKQATLTAGGGIDITGNIISAPAGTTTWLKNTTKVYYNEGNVGIGTTDPQTTLDIRGTSPTIKLLDTRTDGDAVIQFRETSDLFGMDIAYIGNLDNRIYIRGYNNSATAVNHIAINRNDGYVGIGTTSPATPLHIYNTTNAILRLQTIATDDASIELIRGTTTDISTDWKITNEASTGGLHILSSVSGTSTDRFVITNGGKVGIGTTDPQYNLDIEGTFPVIKLLAPTAGSSFIKFFEQNETFGYDMGYNGSANRFVFRSFDNSATPVEHLTISRGSGRFGIGDIPATLSRMKVYGILGDTAIAEFSSSTGSQGINITNTAIATAGTDANISLNLQSKGTGGIFLQAPAGTTRITINGSTGGVSIGGTLSAGATTITGNSAVLGTLEVGSATAELLISGNAITAQGSDVAIPITITTKGTSAFGIRTGATPTTRLSISNTGAVSIGGTLSAGATTITGAISAGSIASIITLTSGSLSVSGNDVSIPLSLSAKGTGALTLSTNTTTRLTIAGDTGLATFANNVSITGTNTTTGNSTLTGNVGIGKAPSLTYKVDVLGDVNVSGNFRIGGNIINSTASVWTTSGINIYNNNTGNVGIGTNNPTTAKLVISGSAGAIGLDMSSTDQYAEMRVIRNSLSSIDKNMYLGYNSGAGSIVRLYSNNLETLRCDGGNVVIPYNLNMGSANINGDKVVGGNSFQRNTYLYSGNEGSAVIQYFATPFSGAPSMAKSMIMALPISSYSRHHLLFCLNTFANNDVAVSTSDEYFRLHTDGYIQSSAQLRVFNEIFGGFYSVSRTNTDYICVQGDYSANNAYGTRWLRVAFESFTAFHRCYTDDELCNNETDEDIDIFKNNYMGRVVIATGKIKTDLSRMIDEERGEDAPEYVEPEKSNKQKPEWYNAMDKDGISIEDAIPVIALSRKKKDKRVFGVLGDPKRSSNNPNRVIVNSIGEGAICVVNTNGNIENGDYIQSSDLLGYGEKQDDDLLHNYTIAKATIDCNFELDSPYYQCHEIENGVRVAFIACSYHCG
jgi:hypothetical protein